MPRTARIAPGGMLFHVLNRANNRDEMFLSDDDYLAFLRVVRDTLQKKPMRVLSFCLMPNHWHFLLWPEADGDLGNFMQAVTTTHVRRWRLNRHTVGEGHLYQGTYKSFPVQGDDHYYAVCRYVERNALRAGMVACAEDWRWGSLWQRSQRTCPEDYPALSNWPVPVPRQWTAMVNRVQTEAEWAAVRTSIQRGCPFQRVSSNLNTKGTKETKEGRQIRKPELWTRLGILLPPSSVRTSIQRGRPFGSRTWQGRVAQRLGLESTFCSRGRPRKTPAT